MPMTSKERLLAAIHHQVPDYVPVGPRIWAFESESYGHSGWLYDLKAAREFDFDPMVFMGSPYPNYVASLMGSYDDLPEVKVSLTIEHLPDSTLVRRRLETPAGVLSDALRRYKPGGIYGVSPNPVWEETLVKDERDLEKLPFLLPKPSASAFGPILVVQEAVGDRGLVQVDLPPALSRQAGWAYEMSEMMVAVYDNPDFVKRLLRIFQDHTLALNRCACEAGVEVIYASWYFASVSSGWSPKLYRELFLPLVKEQVDLVHSYGKLFHYYDDGKMMQVLPMLAEAGVDVASTVSAPPLGDVDLKQAKAEVGERICLNGYVDAINVIKDGTEEQIRETVRQAILDGAPGGGFILGTSDSIRDAPIGNVRAYFRAGREFGNYGHLGRAR
jgi:hypothetical protein